MSSESASEPLAGRLFAGYICSRRAGCEMSPPAFLIVTEALFEKADSTCMCSQAVLHPSTNQALGSLLRRSEEIRCILPGMAVRKNTIIKKKEEIKRRCKAHRQEMSSKIASEPLAGRLLPRLVIMHSSAETPPRQNTLMCRLTA